MKKLILFLFLSSLTSVFSQVKLTFKDSKSKEPISFITIFNERNQEIATSNEEGEIVIKDLAALTNTIYAKSLFFEEKKLELNTLKEGEIILLDPKINLLDEVVVSSGKYVVLTAYYRILNLKNNKPWSFIDTEIKFIIKNNSIYIKNISHRIFDTAPKEDYKISSKNPFYIKDLDDKSLLEILKLKFNLIKNNENNVINIIGKEDKKLYGSIKKISNHDTNSNIRIDISKRSKYYKGIQVEEYHNEDLLKATIKDLKYKMYEFKHENIIDGKKTKFVTKGELFIQNVEYLSKDEYKKIMKLKNNDTSISHYSKEFWKNLDTFTPLNSVVESEIKELLVERK
ncbi:carboxypeptidase-like regulatory domain-containing protein [Flavobacterium undicola]|uniref:carboxypeptidase-like regulatory domain-containing protein n=1 Tax=Flavobacterium undicola TaxID=1932779 RepID=UPI001377EE3A|nr:carboxypeptidase-like regulatory domain-containing protein [Flavobacterium undicola]MBA0884779.1 hypothetical protein [Flavobacterium undicola]